MPLFNVKFVAMDSSMTNVRIEMPPVNVKFVDSSSTDIKYNQPALHRNGHSSVAYVR